MFIEQDDENKQSNQNAPDQSVGAGGGVGSVGTVNAGGNTPSQPASPTTPRAQSFANVQDYLKSNKAQGEQLGQQFTNNLNTLQNTEQKQIDTAATGAKNEINAAKNPFDANLVNTAKTDPTKVANNQSDLSSFLKQWNSAYTGPNSFEASNSYTPAAQAATNAKQQAEQLKSTGGREQFLQDQFHVYGQGNKGLDQTLLQNSGSYGAVQSAIPKFNSLTDYLSNQSKEIGAAATGAQNEAANTQAQTRGAFKNTLTDFEKNLQDRAEALKTNQAPVSAEDKKIQDYLTSLQGYGITPDVGGYKPFNATDITPEKAATQEDYDKAAAYQKLTGTDFSGILNPANKGKGFDQQTEIGNRQKLEEYLKGNLSGADKNLMTQSFDTAGFRNTKDPIAFVQKYVDAAKRLGSGSFPSAVKDAITMEAGKAMHDFPEMADAYNQAMVNLNVSANPGPTITPPPAAYTPPTHLAPTPADANIAPYDPATDPDLAAATEAASNQGRSHAMGMANSGQELMNKIGANGANPEHVAETGRLYDKYLSSQGNMSAQELMKLRIYLGKYNLML